MAARMRQAARTISKLDDASFWETAGSDAGRRRIADAAAGEAFDGQTRASADGIGERPSEQRRRADDAEHPGQATPAVRSGVDESLPARGHHEATKAAGGLERPGGEGRGMPLPSSATRLDALRPRNARRREATGRIAIRLPADAMRLFGAVARTRNLRKSDLFEKVLDGFLRRLEQEGPVLLQQVHDELGWGRRYEIEDDVWSDAARPARLARARPSDPMPTAQISHVVSATLERRFDDTCWQLETSKDALGRLIILGFLLRLSRANLDIASTMGFQLADIEELVRTVPR